MIGKKIWQAMRWISVEIYTFLSSNKNCSIALRKTETQEASLIIILKLEKKLFWINTKVKKTLYIQPYVLLIDFHIYFRLFYSLLAVFGIEKGLHGWPKKPFNCECIHRKQFQCQAFKCLSVMRRTQSTVLLLFKKCKLNKMRKLK